ncbi:hypothetical protein J2R99_002296 [Rhodopseudomonas julia]|uniref:Transposase n=1 Tax=Rhodopseudomonas julia TaxID=200617 RepID=A0ABU0C7C8_9BRAD|nr:hypothetical protein [Rhodopseudomonas julia]
MMRLTRVSERFPGKVQACRKIGRFRDSVSGWFGRFGARL